MISCTSHSWLIIIALKLVDIISEKMKVLKGCAAITFCCIYVWQCPNSFWNQGSIILTIHVFFFQSSIQPWRCYCNGLLHHWQHIVSSAVYAHLLTSWVHPLCQDGHQPKSIPPLMRYTCSCYILKGFSVIPFYYDYITIRPRSTPLCKKNTFVFSLSFASNYHPPPFKISISGATVTWRW